MMPVNISTTSSFDSRRYADVFAERGDVGDGKPHRGGDSRDACVVEDWRPGTEQCRCVVAHDSVDETLSHERTGQRRAAFDKQQLLLPLEEGSHQGGQVEQA